MDNRLERGVRLKVFEFFGLKYRKTLRGDFYWWRGDRCVTTYGSIRLRDDREDRNARIRCESAKRRNGEFGRAEKDDAKHV
jgi:hypothetical protein